MSEINIDSTYGVIVVQDMQAVYVDHNYANIYGYESPEELLGSIDSFLDLISPELHDLARSNYHEIIAGKLIPRGHNFTNVDRNGREFTVFLVEHLIEWNGRSALQVTVIDMSVIAESNKRIRERDLMYKQLITQSGQGIMVHRNFKPLMINQAWVTQMHAESVEQVMALDSLLEIIPAADRPAIIAHYHNIVSGKVVGQSQVVENLCFDGERRYFNVYDNLIQWDGEPAIQVVLEDVTEKVRLEKIVAYHASHDELTDLYNRRAIYEWLDEQFRGRPGCERKMACMLMDIDDFKMVNDNFGHQAGDYVIQSLADVVRRQVARAAGVVGRWGGEEFIAFIPNLNSQQAKLIAEKIRLEFAQVSYQHESGEFNTTVSIGISDMSHFSEIAKTEELIKIADSYLYLAKAGGKNRVHIADS